MTDEKKSFIANVLIFIPVTVIGIVCLYQGGGLVEAILRPMIASVFSLTLLVIIHLITKVKRSPTFYILFILINGLLSWAVVIGYYLWLLSNFSPY